LPFEPIPTSIWRPCWRLPRQNFATIFGVRKLASLGYRMAFLRDPMFSRFGTVPACDGRTDGRAGGQTDEQTKIRRQHIQR